MNKRASFRHLCATGRAFRMYVRPLSLFTLRSHVCSVPNVGATGRPFRIYVPPVDINKFGSAQLESYRSRGFTRLAVASQACASGSS